MGVSRLAAVAIGLAALLLLGACSRLEMDEPVAAGIDSPDPDVAEYLQEILQTARGLPKSGPMRGRLGMAYDVNGFREAALLTYGQAEALDPKDFRWPYFSAVLVAETGEHEKALEALQRAIAIDPVYAPAWLWRGSWLLEVGRPADAVVAFERAGDLGADATAAFGRARALIALDRHAEAIELLDPLARTSNHPYIYRTLGEALRAMGRPEDSRSAMTRGREASPVSWEDERSEQRTVHVRGYASYNLAKSMSADGRVVEALEILQRLQMHHPEASCGRDEEFFLACNLMNSTSIAHARAGSADQALATVQRGLALNADFIPFHLTLANLYREQRDLERALVHVDRALELNPARGYAHEQRGRLLFGMERYADAKAALESALRLEPEKRTTLFYLGLALVELENWAAALERFERVVFIEPDFALGHVFLARSLAEVGRIDDARQAKEQAKEHGADAAELRNIEIRLRELEASR